MVGGQAATRHIMFSPRALDTQFGNCLVVMTSDDPVLRVLDAGGMSRGDISLTIPVRSTSAGDRRSWIDGVLENNGAPPEMAAVVEQMGEALAMADVWPVANRIVADPGGYVWLERFEAPEGPSGTWIVVDGTGTVVAQPTLPDGFQLLEVERDRVIGIWTDELDRQHVRVHALRREPTQRETPLSGCS